MFRRVVGVLVLCAVVIGCAHERSGLSFESVSEQKGQPAEGMARIVVLREKAYTGLNDRGWPIELDGKPMGDVKAGTFVYRDVGAGHHEVTLDLWDFPGVSRTAFDTVEGRTYFFVSQLNGNSTAVTAGILTFGLLGYAAAAASVDKSGPIDLVALDEAAAGQRIAELRLADQ